MFMKKNGASNHAKDKQHSQASWARASPFAKGGTAAV